MPSVPLVYHYYTLLHRNTLCQMAKVQPLCFSFLFFSFFWQSQLPASCHRGNADAYANANTKAAAPTYIKFLFFLCGHCYACPLSAAICCPTFFLTSQQWTSMAFASGPTTPYNALWRWALFLLGFGSASSPGCSSVSKRWTYRYLSSSFPWMPSFIYFFRFPYSLKLVWIVFFFSPVIWA